jgi:hypothetical protein
LLTNRRILAFLIFAGIFSLFYLIGSQTKLPNVESELFLKEFRIIVERIDTIIIFEHNSFLVLPMFVPGFGLVWGTYVAWSTGLSFGALVLTNPSLEKISPLSILYLSPFGLMEFISYSIGMSRSFLLINALVRKKPLKNEIRQTSIEIGIVLALLLAGAFIEFFMVQQFGSNLVQPKI